MKQRFLNRKAELKAIEGQAGRGVFGYITGRRRIGKSALLIEACRKFGGMYHQAIEGTSQSQLEHLAFELKDKLPSFREVTPRNWNEFFYLLTRSPLPPLLAFDEFPYWVSAEPALVSILQKWIDLELPKQKTLLLISGSSQSMLHSYFLKDTAPLYGRARLHLDLPPLSYRWFCRSAGIRTGSPVSFEKFSLVGGVPYYWQLMPGGAAVNIADEVFFKPSALLSEEPRHLLHEEGIAGNVPKAILDMVGRGVSKPSEIASRLGTTQNNLSRPFLTLLDAGLISREIPFGESTNTTKRTLYRIVDPAISFYYRSVVPFRRRWSTMSLKEKKKLLHIHASHFWEIFCRNAFPGSAFYWEPNIEFDLVTHLKEKDKYLVAECKWTSLNRKEEQAVLENLRQKFSNSRLNTRIKNVKFEVFSKKDLVRIS